MEEEDEEGFHFHNDDDHIKEPAAFSNKETKSSTGGASPTHFKSPPIPNRGRQHDTNVHTASGRNSSNFSHYHNHPSAVNYNQSSYHNSSNNRRNGNFSNSRRQSFHNSRYPPHGNYYHNPHSNHHFGNRNRIFTNHHSNYNHQHNHRFTDISNNTHLHSSDENVKSEVVEFSGDIIFVPECYLQKCFSSGHNNTPSHYLIDFSVMYQHVKESNIEKKWSGLCQVDVRDTTSWFQTQDGRVGFRLDKVAINNISDDYAAPLKEVSSSQAQQPSNESVNQTEILHPANIPLSNSAVRTSGSPNPSQKSSPTHGTTLAVVASAQHNSESPKLSSKKKRNNQKRNKKRRERKQSIETENILAAHNIIPKKYIGTEVLFHQLDGNTVQGYICRCSLPADQQNDSNSTGGVDSKMSIDFLKHKSVWEIHFQDNGHVPNFQANVSTPHLNMMIVEKDSITNKGYVTIPCRREGKSIVPVLNDNNDNNINERSTVYFAPCATNTQTSSLSSFGQANTPPISVVHIDPKTKLSVSTNVGWNTRDSCTTIGTITTHNTPNLSSKHSAKTNTTTGTKYVDLANDDISDISNIYSCFSYEDSSITSCWSSSSSISSNEDLEESINRNEKKVPKSNSPLPSLKKTTLNDNLEYLQQSYDCPEKSKSDERSLVVLIPKDKFVSKNILNKHDLTSKSKEAAIFQRMLCIQKKPYPKEKTDESHPSQLCSILNVKGLYHSPHFQVGKHGRNVLFDNHPTITNIIDNNVDYCNSNDKDVKVLNSNSHLISSVYKLMRQLVIESNIVQLILYGNKHQNKLSSKKKKRGKVMQLHIGCTMNNPRMYEDTTMAGGSSPSLHGYRYLTERSLYLLGRLQVEVLRNVFDAMGCHNEFKVQLAGEQRRLHADHLKSILKIDNNNDNMGDYIPFEAETFGMSPPNSSVTGSQNGVKTITPFKIVTPHVDKENCYQKGFDNTVIICVYVPIKDFVDNDVISSLKTMGYKDYIEFTNIKYSRRCKGQQDLPNSKMNKIANIIKEKKCPVTSFLLEAIVTKNDHSWNFKKFVTDIDHLLSVSESLKHSLEVNKSKTSKSIKSDYKHGSVYLSKLEGMDKMCYYSSIIDIIFITIVKFKNELVFSNIVDAIALFSFYSNGPSLFIQTLETIHSLNYKGQNYNSIREIIEQFHSEDKFVNVEDEHWFLWVVSSQMGYGKAEEKEIDEWKSATSTEPRHCSNNKPLPTYSENSWKAWLILRSSIYNQITDVWKAMKSKHKQRFNIHTKKGMDIISKLCSDYIMKISKTAKFGCLTFLQISAALNIVPRCLQTYGEITMTKSGSYKLFDKIFQESNNNASKYTNDNDKMKLYNSILSDVTISIRKLIHESVTMDKIENLCCALGRKRRKTDPIYLFGMRNLIENKSIEGDEFLGLQNFFVCEFNKKYCKMELKMYYGTKYGGKTVMMKKNVSQYVHINGSTKNVEVNIGLTDFPYNIVSHRSRTIRFHDGLSLKSQQNQRMLPILLPKECPTLKVSNDLQSTDITNQSPKVLLLGMKYIKIKENQQTFNGLIELVNNKRITVADGRDMIRILALKRMYNAECYTVSLQEENCDARNHLNTDYNHYKFVSKLQKGFGKIEFEQIILDWFWTPSSWLASQNRLKFFSETLENLVERNVLKGSLFLPFNTHFVEHIVAVKKKIEKSYYIKFVPKSSRENSFLWFATESVNPAELQALGKEPHQDNKYNTVDINKAKQVLDGKIANKEEVISFLKDIKDIDEIRFIELRRK